MKRSRGREFEEKNEKGIELEFESETKNFAVRFTKEAAKEYKDLDGSIIPDVNNALDSLAERAADVGKDLHNYESSKLAGVKEKKLASSGVRIIYSVTDETINVLRIVLVLLVDFKKSDEAMYKEAQKRFDLFKKDGFENIYEMGLYYYAGEDESVQDLDKPSMMDEIFDENFYQFTEHEQEVIYDLVNHGKIVEAYEYWEYHKTW